MKRLLKYRLHRARAISVHYAGNVQKDTRIVTEFCFRQEQKCDPLHQVLCDMNFKYLDIIIPVSIILVAV